MLQWMGGSRRKVAASHTSVKKRQKQYFEQRRQQQHHFTVGSESCTNDRNNINEHPREHQSLDILNFINLSTATPECKSSCTRDGKYTFFKKSSSRSDFSYQHLYSLGFLLMELHILYKFDASLYYRTLFSLPDNKTNEIKKTNTTGDLIDGTERKLSVFDLVDDDHTTANLEECSPSEAHVAFSVEGLGKINTETPVNSPQQPSDRNFAYHRSSPWKDTGQPDTSNVRERLSNFDNELDTIIESSNIFQGDGRYKSPIGIHAKDGGRTQKLRTDHFHKPYISDSRSYFCDPADFNKRRVSDENEWKAKSAFLDGGEGSFYWKEQQPCQEEIVNLNFKNYGKDYTESRSSPEHSGRKKRDYLETTWRPNMEVQRPQRLERAIDHPSFSKATYFKSHENFDFDNVFDKPAWSSIVPEEDKDNLWANEIPITQLETNTRQRKRETNSFRNLGEKNSLNNDFFQESWEDWGVDDQHLKRKVVSGKQFNLSDSGNLKPTHQRESSFLGDLESPNNWFTGFTSAGVRSDITSERDKPYPSLKYELGSSHLRPSRARDSIPETWAPKLSVGGSGDVNCVSGTHRSKLADDICGFENDMLSGNDNEQRKDVYHSKKQGDETSSSVANNLSDENEYVW
ncbi:unnamed protein product [Cochlearia groenlandica]